MKLFMFIKDFIRNNKVLIYFIITLIIIFIVMIILMEIGIITPVESGVDNCSG